MPDNVVEVQGLTRRFGPQTALDDVNLTLKQGAVHGLVGVNGAGKTTLIKHLLGLLRAQAGSVRVFGLDPADHPVPVLKRIGYLSEERELPEWMTIHEMLNYTAAFHPQWDAAYAQELLENFQLDGRKKIKNLSKGMRAQAGLVAAVAHRPDLLLLDEPSTGLDPIVRKDILNAIVRTVAEAGRTVLFSSHLLDEIELMSDQVIMFDHGRLVLEGQLDQVKAEHQLLSVRWADSPSEAPQFPGLLSSERLGSSWRLVCSGEQDQVVQRIHNLGGDVTQVRMASLQEIFVARAGRQLVGAA